MKKMYMAGMAMMAIIAVRIALSYTLTEQAAEVFTRMSVTALICYSVLTSVKRRRELGKSVES